jgi:hypothetical protein
MTGVLGVVPQAWADLEGALRSRRPVFVYYHGRRRLICLHTLGWKDGRAMLLGYQTGGQTSTGALPAEPGQRWRCLFVDELKNVVTADKAAPWGAAANYNASRPFNAIDYVSVTVPAEPSERR